MTANIRCAIWFALGIAIGLGIGLLLAGWWIG